MRIRGSISLTIGFGRCRSVWWERFISLALAWRVVISAAPA
ncbi:MAG: hypothetical protein ACK559_05410 [bacterium]